MRTTLLVIALIPSVVLFLIFKKIHLKLYLVKSNSMSREGNLIPLTAELKKRTFWRTLLQRNWHEDLDITLRDDQGHSFIYQIGFHFWRGYYLTLKQATSKTYLNKKPILDQKKYYLKTGMILEPGDQNFSILVTAENYERTMRSDLSYNSQETDSSQSFMQ